MTYLKKIDAWLTEQLTSLEPGVEIADVRYRIKQKIYNSFRNGQRACPKCNPRSPKQAPVS